MECSSLLGAVPEDERSWQPGERTVCGAGEGLGAEGVLSGAWCVNQGIQACPRSSWTVRSQRKDLSEMVTRSDTRLLAEYKLGRGQKLMWEDQSDHSPEMMVWKRVEAIEKEKSGSYRNFINFLLCIGV